MNPYVEKIQKAINQIATQLDAESNADALEELVGVLENAQEEIQELIDNYEDEV